ncbi:hypothetical protein AB0J71_32555 [Nonomuraea sp. NPDC049637]|uniref:hypothetical protein n=1 Tax=Nonomuraea sp. NPDC049637 TaxID=3154356 RepID=UPI00343AC1D4
MVTGEAMKLVDSHRVHGMLAARGQVSGPVSEGGLGRYTVAVDVRAAFDGLDLAAFLDVYDPLPAMQDIEDEYERVRAGDPAAQARLRGRLIEEFGERATYELWIDGEGRPVRERLTAVTPVEVVFSHWDATAVSAPPADQVMVR